MSEFAKTIMSPIGEDKAWTRHVLPVLFFIGLVFIVNYPLTLNLGTHVVGRPFDDTFEAIWQLSAIAKAVFRTHTNPFFSPDVFYPQGWYTASGAQPPWYLLLLTPITVVAGPVLTFNIATMTTFILAGFGVYRFVVRLGGRRPAGIVAGCVYIAAPMLTLRLGGHLNVLIASMFLPYAADSLHKTMSRPAEPLRSAPMARSLLQAGFFLAATILGHWYFLFIATLSLIAMAIFTPTPASWRIRLMRLALVGGIALALLAPFALLTWDARRTMLPGGGQYSLADAAQLGFSPDYLFSPNLLHPMWRERATAVFPVSGEQDIVSLGYAAIVLAIVGLLTSPLSRTRPFIAMGLTSFILGLGPVLRWRGQMVILNVPAWLGDRLAALMPGLALGPGQAAVVLPDLLLYYLLPLFSSLRVWARFDIPLVLVVAIMAGLGVDRLLSRGRAGNLLVVVLGIMVIFEGVVVPYRDFTPVAVNNRSANTWLADRPSGSSLIEYPRGWVDKLAMYSQSLHGLSVVNGYMSFQPTFLANVDGDLGKWPVDTAMPILREWGVDYLVLSGSQASEEFLNDILPSTMTIDGLCLVKTFPDAFGLPGFDQTYIFAILPLGESCPPR